MRQFFIAIFIMALFSTCRHQQEQKAESVRPNIIFIFSDDHALRAISAYGDALNKTPNIDRLADEGMLFRNSFCTNSICGPSRAVIQTGKFSHINGFKENGDTFDASQQTFPKRMREGGYTTAIIGKWHLKSEPAGYDYWKVLPGQGSYYNPDFLSSEGIERINGYVTDIITDMTVDWLENHRDKSKPFMLMTQHKAPHREWTPGPEHLNMYDDVTFPEPASLFDDYAGRAGGAKEQEMEIGRHLTDSDLKIMPDSSDKEDMRRWQGRFGRMTEAQYEQFRAAYEDENKAMQEAGLTEKEMVRWKYQRYIKDYMRCIASLDDNIGRLLDYLDSTGLADNTIVMYSSDQGFYLGEHGWFDKRWMYEESLQMPLIVRWPKVTTEGSESQALVQNVDYAETFLDLAGLPVPADMQGRSLVPILKGGQPERWRQAIYFHYYEYPAVHMVPRHYGVRDDRYKLMYFYERDEWELFDLQRDPDEMQSVYGQAGYAEVQQRMKETLKALRQQYRDSTGGGFNI
jgi:arylsulfatase A-like enzyme